MLHVVWCAWHMTGKPCATCQLTQSVTYINCICNVIFSWNEIKYKNQTLVAVRVTVSATWTHCHCQQPGGAADAFQLQMALQQLLHAPKTAPQALLPHPRMTMTKMKRMMTNWNDHVYPSSSLLLQIYRQLSMVALCCYGHHGTSTCPVLDCF